MTLWSLVKCCKSVMSKSVPGNESYRVRKVMELVMLSF